jgi:hypothetical protein
MVPLARREEDTEAADTAEAVAREATSLAITTDSLAKHQRKIAESPPKKDWTTSPIINMVKRDTTPTATQRSLTESLR